MSHRPRKKTDKELWDLISQKIASTEYSILRHAKERQKDRNISDIDVLNILENRIGRKRKA